MSTLPSTARLDDLIRLSLAAGDVIMEVRSRAFEVQEKADGSAVTAADQAAEEVITAGLNALDNSIPIIAEEAASEGKIPEAGSRFFLVDPLDGTKEFINKRDEFTVNIALVVDGLPVMGVVFAPAKGILWAGDPDGAIRQKASGSPFALVGEPEPIRARDVPADGRIAIASRSHRSPETDEALQKLKTGDIRSAGSSLKFCVIAEGEADVYPRLGRTMEWDTAAGHAVLKAAGGRVHVFANGEEQGPLTYGKVERDYDNPHFIAWGA